MPHDNKGREIHEGDVVAAKHWIHGNRDAACLVLGVNPGSETCNLTVLSVQAPTTPTQTVTAKEVELLLKRDGSRPAS